LRVHRCLSLFELLLKLLLPLIQDFPGLVAQQTRISCVVYRWGLTSSRLLHRLIHFPTNTLFLDFWSGVDANQSP
jgi:hypothetical protein